jgi:hypothetical protein
MVMLFLFHIDESDPRIKIFAARLRIEAVSAEREYTFR